MHQPPAALRRLILIIATMIAVTLTAGISATANVAHADTVGHQGGCNPHVQTHGFDIGVCIDDHGTNTTAYPDIYVNAAHSLGLRESCRIDIETWDDHNNKLADTPVDCTLGHHAAAPVTVSSTARVHSFARLWFDGSAYPTGDSPAITLTTTPVNPDWTAASQFFGNQPSGTAWKRYPAAAGSTGDDGIVLVRLFIPTRSAAGGLLLGDNRGFSADPTSSSRGVLAWNTATGQVTLTVSHSTIVGWDKLHTRIAYTPQAALPVIATDWAQAFAARDQARDDNRYAIDTSAPAGTLHVRLSLLNSLTNRWAVGPINFGAWSVDDQLTITRTGPGSYQATELTGNGYPAIEAYYYPHTTNTATRSVTITKRSVAPLFRGQPMDEGGGEQALDSVNWSTCTPTQTALTCQNIAPFAPQSVPLWVGDPLTEAQWKAPWTTQLTQTNAL